MGTPSGDLEENIDSVSLRCVADANPPATVIWRRVHQVGQASANKASGNSADIYSFQEALEFSPVNRKDSATYSCEAKNTIGTSNLITVPVDVKCKLLHLVIASSLKPLFIHVESLNRLVTFAVTR